MNVNAYHCPAIVRLKFANNPSLLRVATPSKIAQIGGVDSKGEAELGTEGMVPCTF